MLEDLLYGPDGWFTVCPPPDWWHRTLAENKAPFPWFGGKSKAIDLVWDRFGEVKNYVEPFAGSMAVLLGRPHAPSVETVNDYDGFVSNFWRAIQADSDKVADFADWPVNETDLHSRHKWLVKRKAMLRARLLEDPTFFDARIAGWWVWGLCAWIGAGWCQGKGESSQLPSIGAEGQRPTGGGKGVHGRAMRQQLPDLGGVRNGSGEPGANHGRGVHAQKMRLPHLGAGTGGEDDHACAHYGKGVHVKGMREQLPHLAGNGEKTDHGRGVHGKGMRLSEQLPFLAGDGKGTGHAIERGVHSQRMRLSEQLPDVGARAEGVAGGRGVHGQTSRSRLHEVFRAIAQRLRYTRITCGDFERILSPAVTWRHGITGVFLDPPYPSDAGSTGGIYSTEAHERETFDRAFWYCVENGTNKDLRIALCYYEGTTVRPAPIDGLLVEGPVEDVTHTLRSLGWEIVSWKAGGGYGGQSGRGNENASRERIAFSPHCLKAKQGTLF